MAILLNDNINVETGKHLDNKYGPYADTASVISSIPEFKRIQGLTVGIISGGTLSEYWFRDGTTDLDLILKTGGNTGGGTGTTGNFLPLSGGTLTGFLSSTNSACINGVFEAGSGATTSLFVDNNVVGVNTETPNESLTIVGNVSASGIIYANGGNSFNWNQGYTTVNSNSATWGSAGVDTSVRSLTSVWQDTYTNFKAQSANNDSVYTTVNSNSATWNSAGVDTSIRALTSVWQDTYTNFKAQSANNDSVYTTVNSNSATWGFGGSVASNNYLPLSGGTMTGTINLSATTETKATPSISSSILTLNLNTATIFYVTLNSNIITFALTNPPSSPRVFSFTLQFVADGTPRAITWPTGTKWPGGTAPTMTSTASKVDTFTFLTHDGGSTWFAYTVNQNQ